MSTLRDVDTALLGVGVDMDPREVIADVRMYVRTQRAVLNTRGRGRKGWARVATAVQDLPDNIVETAQSEFWAKVHEEDLRDTYEISRES